MAHEGVITTWCDVMMTEGLVNLVFDKNDPSLSLSHRLLPLEKGDNLTIEAPDQTVIWDGIIKPQKGSFLIPGACNMHTDWVQAKMDPATWLSWFVHEPPLTARLKKWREPS